jgi:hypothetical protein
MNTTAAAKDVATSSSSSSCSHTPLFSAVTEWRHLAHDNVTTAGGAITAATASATATAAATFTAARKRSVEHMYDEQAVLDEGYEVLPRERQRANSLSAMQVSLLYFDTVQMYICVHGT